MTGRQRVPVQGEIPNPINPPTGCTFNPRCPFANERCRREIPPLRGRRLPRRARAPDRHAGRRLDGGWSRGRFIRCGVGAGAAWRERSARCPSIILRASAGKTLSAPVRAMTPRASGRPSAFKKTSSLAWRRLQAIRSPLTRCEPSLIVDLQEILLGDEVRRGHRGRGAAALSSDRAADPRRPASHLENDRPGAAWRLGALLPSSEGRSRLSELIGSRQPRLVAAQSEHWGRLFSGKFDAAYVTSIRRIGLVHHKIGLEPRWYSAATPSCSLNWSGI